MATPETARRSRADAIRRIVTQRLTRLGYSCQGELCLKSLSSTAHARIGLGKQAYRDGSVDLSVSVGAHFSELKALAEQLALPIAGSVAWTVSCDISELAKVSTWRFTAKENPTNKVDSIVETIETLVVSRLSFFSSYESAIQELEKGFPCLWSQKRLVIPLALLALGRKEDACKRVEEFSPREPVSESQREYVRFAEHFAKRVCQGTVHRMATS